MTLFKNVPQRMRPRGVGGDYGANRFGVALDEWRVQKGGCGDFL